MEKEQIHMLPISGRYLRIAELPLRERERRKLGLWQGATLGDALALQMFRAALAGSVQAAREIRESIEGRAAERIPNLYDREVEVHVTYDDPVTVIRTEQENRQANELKIQDMAQAS